MADYVFTAGGMLQMRSLVHDPHSPYYRCPAGAARMTLAQLKARARELRIKESRLARAEETMDPAGHVRQALLEADRRQVHGWDLWQPGNEHARPAMEFLRSEGRRGPEDWGPEDFGTVAELGRALDRQLRKPQQ